MKQTAVEWLIEQMEQRDFISIPKPEWVQQAKEMDKKQSLELIKLTAELTGVATVDDEIAKMELIDVYNHYYGKLNQNNMDIETSEFVDDYQVGDICMFIEPEEDSPRVFTTHKVDMEFGVVYYYKLNGVEETIGISNILRINL